MNDSQKAQINNKALKFNKVHLMPTGTNISTLPPNVNMDSMQMSRIDQTSPDTIMVPQMDDTKQTNYQLEQDIDRTVMNHTQDHLIGMEDTILN